MGWPELKARLLASGSARLEGEPAGMYIARSTAGPGAGGGGSVFFSSGVGRIRLALNPDAPTVIIHDGEGRATIRSGSDVIAGRLLEPGCHCPRQAYITVTSSCRFACKYCPVPAQEGGRRKSISEITGLVAAVKHRIDAISLTSGVLSSIEEEEDYVLGVVGALKNFGLPIGISIYPTASGPDRFWEAGVTEVKWNLETPTPGLFTKMCPGLDRDVIQDALDRSVTLYGREHVFTNLIAGLGESDDEMEACIIDLAGRGIIPVIRPLNPVAGVRDMARPSASRLLHLYHILGRALDDAGLDPRNALTMCVACHGCDMVPGWDT